MVLKASLESEVHGKLEFEVMQNNIVFIKDGKGNNVVLTHKEGTPIVADLLKFADEVTKTFKGHLVEKKKLEGLK